jgi:hypothetical protein
LQKRKHWKTWRSRWKNWLKLELLLMQVDLHDTGLELGSLSNRPSVVRNNQHQSKDFRHRSRACACHVDKQSNIERQSQASHPVCDSKIGHRRLHVFSH